MTWCISARSSSRTNWTDIFVIKKGLEVDDKIVHEGVRQVRDGEKVEYEFRPPEQVMANQKQAE